MSFYNDHNILRNRDDPTGHAWAFNIDGSKALTGDMDAGGNAITNVGDVDGVDVSDHAARHIRGGADLIDADRLTVTWVPTNYSRDASPPEAGDLTDLTAHLKGIDNALASVGGESWAATLAIGADSSGTSPRISASDDILAEVSGTSDIGVVGGEFRDLHLTGAIDFAGTSGLISTAGIDRLRINATELEPVSAGLDLGAPGNEFGNLDQDGYLTQLERNSLGIAAAAGKGYWWVRDDAPSVPIFTDDAGTDHNLLAPGPTTDDWAAVLANGATSGGTSPTLSSGDDLLFAAAGASDIGSSAAGAGSIYAEDLIELGGTGAAAPAFRFAKTDAGASSIRWESNGFLRYLQQFTGAETWQLQKYDAAGAFEATSMAVFAAGGIRFDADGGGTTFVGGDVTAADAGANVVAGANSVGTAGRFLLRGGTGAAANLSYEIAGLPVWDWRGSATDLSVRRYVGGVGTDNPLVIRNSDGRVTMVNQVDVGETAAGNGTLRLLSPSANVATLQFVSAAGVQNAITASFPAADLRFAVDGNVERVLMNASEIRPVFGQSINLGGSDTSTYFNDLTLNGSAFVAGAPSTGATYNPGGDDLLIGPGTGSRGLTIWPSDTGNAAIYVKNSATANIGYQFYDLNLDEWVWGVDGSGRVEMTSSHYGSRTDGAMDLGSSSGNRWGSLHILNGSVATYKSDVSAQFALDMYSDGVRGWTLHHQTNEHLSFDRYNTTTGVFEGRALNLNRAGDIGVESRGIFGGAVLVAGAPSGGYNPTADDIGVGDGTGSSGQSFLTSATGLATVAVRSPSSGLHGFWQFDTNNSRHTWGINGSYRLRLDGNALEPWAAGGIDFGSATRPVDNLFLSDTLAFTGTSGTISVNGTDEWEWVSGQYRPASNGGANVGAAVSGLGSTYYADASTPTTPSSANAAVYSDTADSRMRVVYASGDTRRLDQAPVIKGYTGGFDGEPELAIVWQGTGTYTGTSIDGTAEQRSILNFTAPYDCKILVHCTPTDPSNDTFGVMTCRIYEDYDYAAGDVDNDTVNWNSTSGMRTYEFSSTFDGGKAYGITLQPTTDDTSYVNVSVELQAV